MKDCKDCKDCDKNNIVCQKLLNNTDFDENVISSTVFRKIQLSLALKYEFYQCELSDITQDNKRLSERLKNNGINPKQYGDYYSCSYYGRESLLNHFRTGWLIFHVVDGIVLDNVELVS